LSGDITKNGAGGAVGQRSTAGDIASFLDRAKSVGPAAAIGRGRLIFALDATMSRQPMWDLATKLQADMFNEAQTAGGNGLDVQLVFYRGLAECRASRWVRDSETLTTLMRRISVEGGQTQIRRVLLHARDETRTERVQAMVFVGDAVEEDIDALATLAGELGLLKMPCFMFQEGYDAGVETAFKMVARLSGGAWSRFDAGAAHQLKSLLGAVAAYASGGRKALESLSYRGGEGAKLLLGQVR
jgi:hypothetical protein